MDNNPEYLNELEKKFLRLKSEVCVLLGTIDTKKQTHLQNYIYFAHHPLFSFVESIVSLCKNGRPLVATVLLRTLFELHINIIYHQLGDSEKRLALSTDRMFRERMIILGELKNLIEKYPNLESSDSTNLFNGQYLKKVLQDLEIDLAAVQRGNPNIKGIQSKIHLVEKAKECDKGEVKNAEAGHFQRMYSLIYRYLSPVSHLNIEGLQAFVGQDKEGNVCFHDGDNSNFIASEGIHISLAYVKDLYDNKILAGKILGTVGEIESYILGNKSIL